MKTFFALYFYNIAFCWFGIYTATIYGMFGLDGLTGSFVVGTAWLLSAAFMVGLQCFKTPIVIEEKQPKSKTGIVCSRY